MPIISICKEEDNQLTRSLEDIRRLYRDARSMAKTEDAAYIDQIIRNIQIISECCRDLYHNESVFGKAKCKSRADGFDQIIAIIKQNGLKDARVKRFFCFTPPAPSTAVSGSVPIVPPCEPAKKGANRKVPVSSDATPDRDPIDDLLIEMTPPKRDSSVADDASAPPKAPSSVTEGAFTEGSPFPGEKSPVTTAPKEMTEAPTPPPAVEDTAPVSGAPAKEDASVPANEGASSGGLHVVPAFAPESLDDFIGQEHVVKRIKDEIVAARKQGRAHIDHILLLGNKGLGKTTLMKLIAKELGVRLEMMDASQFGNDVRSQRAIQKFLERISERDEPVIIAFDEIHALPKHIQTALLTLLSEGVYSYLDNSGIVHNLPIREFTFVGATTDAQDVLHTLKDRCNNLTFYLKDYSRDDLAQIFVNKFAAVGLTVVDAVLEQCINRCRSSIREVDSFVKGLKTKAIIQDVQIITVDMAEEYFRDIDRDAIGLKTKDIEILKAIRDEASGVISEDTLAARVHMDAKVMTKEFEPYLLKIGFVSISSRGRSLTEKGLAYVNAL